MRLFWLLLVTTLAGSCGGPQPQGQALYGVERCDICGVAGGAHNRHVKH